MPQYPQINRPGHRSKAIVPTDAGVPGTPIGLLLALTHSPDLHKPFDALYVGVTGDIVIVGVDGNAIAFGQVPVGMLEVPGWWVKSTGTTAQEIVAIYR